MDRREAVQVLREICECIPDESAVSYVFLEQSKTALNSREKTYDLHIRMQIEEITRKNIESVIRKRGLLNTVSNGDFVVSAIKSPAEIVV